MRATALISQSALQHNLALVRQLAPKAKVVNIIKANAYGHRLDFIAPLITGGDMLGVSTLTEAQQLRTKTQTPILLLLGVFSSAELQNAIDLKCHIVLHSCEQIALINQSRQAVNVWLKINTGMNRLGLSAQQYRQYLPILQANSWVNIACVMSHFACADVADNVMNTTQFERFKTLTDHKTARSMANSAAVITQKNAAFDFVRPGIMLYGASPFNTIDTRLKPVMQFSAPVIAIQTVQAGERVGYGATWVSPKKTTLAIIAVGYGDGYPRSAKTGTLVLIKNTLCPLVGRVSMDLICVDIGELKRTIGTRAILWGHEKLRVETIAQQCGTIAYTLLTGVRSRVNFQQSP